MAITKNPIIRYHALDRCFRNPGRKFYIEDLIEVCNDALFDLDPQSSGVQLRQIRDDIKFMKDSKGYNAPIESFKDAHGRKHYYRYEDLNFSITNQPLNEEEVQHLKEALFTLTRFKGMPQFEWVQDMMTRLKFGSDEQSQEIISFQANPELKGMGHFDRLYSAIVNQKVLKIEYTPFGKEKITFDIHPYYIKQYNSRWFLFGMNHNYSQLTNLPLDRIDSLTETRLPYVPNAAINFEDFFYNTIGVSIPIDAEPQKVLIKIDAKLWPYIETKPLHHTQKLKEKAEDFTMVQITVHLNYELEALILSKGEQLEVVEPKELRDKIKQRVENILKKY